MASSVALGREAFARQAWREAYEHLAAAEGRDVDDLERLAVAAYLVGHDEPSVRAWEEAHNQCVRGGDPARAARCAFWLGLGLLLRGDMARAGGWMARAERLAAEAGGDCPARGYLLVTAFMQSVESDPEAGSRLADEMVDIATRWHDSDLLAFGLLCGGEAALIAGDITTGMKLLDESMLSVQTGEVSPIPAGIIYCAVIEKCMESFDLRRAAEWTEALSNWCSAQPDLVPYRGNCLVHRAQVLQARGDWDDAVVEAARANRHLAQSEHPALGIACYEQGELSRLRGEFAAAENAYRVASRHGFEPAPGLALLRLAEGNVAAAITAICRVLDETKNPLRRPPLLAAAVEIHLAAGDVASAAATSEELSSFATTTNVPLLHGAAHHAAGCVRLAEGDPRAALASLRQACARWRELEMPYHEARSRVEIAAACKLLGDHDAVALELDAARATFSRLGARPDLERIERLVRIAGDTLVAASPTHSSLTERECQVLREVAAGKTNREIAAELVISEHTVGRHLQNIFLKLGLSSRAAATAYAYQNGLV